MAFNDINIFDTTQDVGAILPPQINAPGPLASYFTRPMVPSPASRRRDTLKGIAQFVPFLGGEIAKYDNDKLGMALSSLDALGPAGTAAKGAVLVGKQAAKKGLGSLDQPKDMMFVHNTSENAIKSFDEMGGIPSPSLAVQTADVPLKGFGQIQLIGKPKNFDPAVDPRNAVYSADAYTPRAPKKIRLAKDDASARFMQDYKEEVAELVQMNNVFDGTLERVAGHMDNLKKPTSPRTTEIADDDIDRFFTMTSAPKTKYMREKGLQSIDSQKKYKTWLNAEFDKYFKQEGVLLEGNDALDFATTVKPYTLDNATNNMIKETQRGGEGGFGGYGPNRLRALMTKKLTDLEDIKSRRFTIQDNPGYSNFDQGIEDVLITESKLADDGDAIYNIAMEEQDELIKQIALNIEDGYSLEDAVDNAYHFYDVKPTQRLVDNTIDVFKQNAARNVEYLEAKPMRSVGFEEFAGAIVPPRTSQEVIDILEKRGLKVIESDIETDFLKTKARQKFKDQMFSIAPIAGAGGITALSLSDNIDEDDKGLGSIPPRQ
tara:strand:- start:30 stop:1664 length:1635 start_codon:yes stop_codon:yes gene_type:complete